MRRFALLPLIATSCVGPGLLTDGSSIAVGNHATGLLRGGRRLPSSGEGYLVPSRWKERQRSFGTDELVELLVRSSRRVARVHRGGVLGIADLSPRGGGPTPEHRSHRNGRDVDLLYYATDAAGKPLVPAEMTMFDRQGTSVPPASLPATQPGAPAAAPPLAAAQPAPAAGQRLDVARTWELVKVLVTDPQVSVQWIFIGRPIAQMLLVHARRIKEPEYLIARAAAVMHQPSDAQSHMDHLHLRLFCAPSDRHQGCADRGPARWLKKELKYAFTPPDPPPTLPLNLAQLALRPVRLLGL